MSEIEALLSGKGAGDENFPVASRIIAARHRGPILAFYRFVRAADDIVDHATLQPAEKHALIDRLEAALLGSGPAEAVAEPLRRTLAERGLPARHALDLLTAFRQDIDTTRYPTWDDLIGYCRYSAMPVGRFVLDVHGEDPACWPGNDALCAALQVINHLQDCAKDHRALDRVYLPTDWLARNGASVADLAGPRSTPGLIATIRETAAAAAGLLATSAGFARQIRDTRLALEVAAIQRLAEVLAGRLARRDPLADSVHLSKAGAAAVALPAMAREGLARLLKSPPQRTAREAP